MLDLKKIEMIKLHHNCTFVLQHFDSCSQSGLGQDSTAMLGEDMMLVIWTSIWCVSVATHLQGSRLLHCDTDTHQMLVKMTSIISSPTLLWSLGPVQTGYRSQNVARQKCSCDAITMS